MDQKHYTMEEISQELSVKSDHIKEWVDLELVVPSKTDQESYFVAEDVERFRVIRNLTQDLEVNLEGVEVILRMRDKMIAMERWIREVFELLNQHNLLTEELMEQFKGFSK